jgi:hypothetical protein
MNSLFFLLFSLILAGLMAGCFLCSDPLKGALKALSARLFWFGGKRSKDQMSLIG